MKTLMTLILLAASLNIFANVKDEDLVCGVYLYNNTNDLLAQKVITQSMSGMSAGTMNGSSFYVEGYKKRFFRKPLALSEIAFSDFMNTYNRQGEFQFFRHSAPNRYGIFTKHEPIGEKIVVNAYEMKIVNISDDYVVKVFCNIVQN